MTKKTITAIAIATSLIYFNPVSAQKGKLNAAPAAKSDVKFIDNIEVNFESGSDEVPASIPSNKDATNIAVPKPEMAASDNTAPSIETVTRLQFKYGVLLNTEIELIKNFALYQSIDEWYGTPYRLGGTTKNGIDCSAFVRAVYTTLFGILLPRTAHEQYQAMRQIMKSELKEGDLVFFNTQGGVSHVGIYLQNNKFVHAATSEGVMISDLDDSYWSKRYIGAGHYDMAVAHASVSQP